MSTSILGLYNQRIGSAPKARPWSLPGWDKGANNYAEDNEIKDNEFYRAENIEMVGKSSVRMPRRGCREFATITGATKFNGWGIYKNPNTDDNFVLAMFNGHLYKITTSGVVTEIDDGITWDEDAKMRGILLRNFFYFGNGIDKMSKTDGDTVTQWDEITAVAGLSVSHSTGAGDTYLYAYTVTAITEGETESAAEESVFAGELADGTEEITIEWTRKTDTNIKGYNIYRAINGSTLTLLTFVQQQPSGATMSFIDDGTIESSYTAEAPTFNTTGGVIGSLFAKYANSLFVSGNSEEKDVVFHGGTGSNWESFSPDVNGGWIIPGRGDGDETTAMIGFEDFLMIFKNNSIWKFYFGSDGGPVLVSVIPQYGTSSPDTVARFEKDIMFLGTDNELRLVGYEPNQLNVIRATSISNRVQPRIDSWDKSTVANFFGVYWESKYILCNGSEAIPYDRRYIGFLDKWTNYNYDGFLVWDKASGQQLLFGASGADGKIYQLLVNNTYDDDGTNIPCSFRVKRIDGGSDTVLKTFYFYKIKLKNPSGKISLTTYKDGNTEVDTTNVDFSLGGGIDEYMFDEPMFDESVSVETISDALQIIKKELYLEAYSIYPQITISGSQSNHCIVQTMSGVLEVEDYDYDRDEIIV